MTDQGAIAQQSDRPGQPGALSEQQTCMLTTFSRTTGRSHDGEMRFALLGARLYMLSEAGGEAEWVQNVLVNPEVSLRISGQTLAGMARVLLNEQAEEQRARELLAAKYEGWQPGQPLGAWAREALPVVVELRA